MKLILEVIYIITAMTGAAIVASNIGENLIGYWVFLVSSAIGAHLAYHSNASRSIVIVNVIFGCINVIGIIRA